MIVNHSFCRVISSSPRGCGIFNFAANIVAKTKTEAAEWNASKSGHEHSAQPVVDKKGIYIDISVERANIAFRDHIRVVISIAGFISRYIFNVFFTAITRIRVSLVGWQPTEASVYTGTKMPLDSGAFYTAIVIKCAINCWMKHNISCNWYHIIICMHRWVLPYFNAVYTVVFHCFAPRVHFKLWQKARPTHFRTKGFRFLLWRINSIDNLWEIVDEIKAKVLAMQFVESCLQL